jgi:serine/threonine-protein kinase
MASSSGADEAPSVDELAERGLEAEAAQLAESVGDHARASLLFERACDFAASARQAERSGDLRRALLMAALSGDAALVSEVVSALAIGARTDAIRAAEDLRARGHDALAGDLFARSEAPLEAARAFASAGDASRAAAQFELGSQPAEAAKVLEAALRKRPDDAALRSDLAHLLVRHGRIEPALRVLQGLDRASSAYAQTLPLRVRLLDELGLRDAAQEARRELTSRGIDEAPHPSERRPVASVEARLFGRYVIEREVATTPSARVLEATDGVSGERVALKILVVSGDGSGRDVMIRFEREARVLEALRHPNVLPLRAYLADGPAIVVPWMAGGSLAEFMLREPIAPSRAVAIVDAVLAALGEAHRVGILHRDVKPSNVLFDAAGTPLLADFGAAHLGDLSRTATAGSIGTFAYMSPEQRVGDPATIESDIYGAGALLFALLTGRPPLESDEDRALEFLRLGHPDLDSSHAAVLASFLARDPRLRPASAHEARDRLRTVKWPDRRPPHPLAVQAPPDAPTAEDGRLGPPLELGDGPDGDRRRHDRRLGRDVLVIELDEASLAQARAFAASADPRLPCVLRARRDEASIWVEPTRGNAFSKLGYFVPSPESVALLRAALQALHRAGGTHGAVDREHVYVHEGELLLAYPRHQTEASAEDDLRCFARLFGT